MRRFAFEADIYETLSCIPMAVREKLDRVAIKISLEQWLSFDLSERRRICDHPITTEEECSGLAALIRQLVLVREGVAPEVLSPEQQRLAFPSDHLPDRVASNARLLGLEILPAMWRSLHREERYALMKLGGRQRIKRNFEAALREFFPHWQSISSEHLHIDHE